MTESAPVQLLGTRPRRYAFSMLRAQRDRSREIDTNLGKPRGLADAAVERRVVHVEVVLVVAELHEELQVAVVAPTVADTARPESQLLVTEEVLLAFGKSVIRLGTIESVEARRVDAQRVLVHEHARSADLRGLEIGQVGDAGRRLVIDAGSDGLVLRADGAHRDEPARRLRFRRFRAAVRRRA